MSKDPTQELPREGSFEARVFAEFAALREEVAALREEVAEVRADIARLDARQQKFEERLTTLEEKVDSRLRETRPIWETVQLGIKRLDMKFDMVIRELYDVRADSKFLDKRLTELEAL